MNNSTISEAASCISVKKIFHRDAWYIGFFFAYSKSWYNQIKTLRNTKYSKTFKCLYIPYTKKAYNEFRSLQIPHKIIKKDYPSRTRQSPKKSELSAKQISGPMNERGKLESDIQSGSSGMPNIIWQAQVFHIKVSYDAEDIKFLKGLYGCYWNAKQRCWICKATSDNFQKLQDRYQYWEGETYEHLDKLTRAYKKRAKVIIKAISGDLTKLEVRIVNASKAVEWVKNIPLRTYDPKIKSWIIPRDKQTVDRFEAQCKEAGYVVRLQLSWDMQIPLSKSRNSQKKLKSVLHGVPVEQLELMQSYAQVFIRENYSYATMKIYCSAFRSFLYYLKDLNEIQNLTRQDLENYLNHVSEKEVSYGAINRHISAIKFYYEKLGGWSKMRLSQVNRPRQPKNLPFILSIGEVKRVFDVVQNSKHRSMLFLAYGCGLRAGEIVNLQLRDIMMDRGQIFIRGGKGKKDRVVMLPKMLVPILGQYIQEQRPDRWLFPGQNRACPYSHSSLRNVFKRALRASGVDDRHKLHNLRHSFATHLMERGTQQRLIQKLLGHSSSKTTEIYTHISRGSITQVESPLDQLGIEGGKKTGKKGVH